MKLESLSIRRFKALEDFHLGDSPRLCVLVGANGTGKSTVFRVFDFLRDALQSDVFTALRRQGGSRGFQEVRSRGTEGPIEITIQYRRDASSVKVTYELVIDEEGGRPAVEREVLKYRRGSSGRPWHFLDFSRGEGWAVTNEFEDVSDITELDRERETLKAPDLLAIKGLAQFKRFPAAMALGEAIENWHISDFQIGKARIHPEVQHAEHLSRDGANLALVVDFLHKRHPEVLERICTQMARRIPGMEKVVPRINDEGIARLEFHDRTFQEPLLAQFVSDGTIKMLAYLVLLYDPSSHPLLCVEEPENQLYPRILPELVEEFRDYARRGGQVFVSTHSPDLLNALELDEVYWLVKEGGFTRVKRTRDDEQIRQYFEMGDRLGFLWKEGLFQGVDP